MLSLANTLAPEKDLHIFYSFKTVLLFLIHFSFINGVVKRYWILYNVELSFSLKSLPI